MDQHAHDAKKISRRSFARSLATTAGVIPLLPLVVGQQGCKKQPKDDGPQIKQTSPITIGGGGSVSIKFDPSYYEPVPGEPNKFVNKKGDTLHTWRILTSLIPPEWKTISDPNCRIVIHCVNPTGTPNDSPITIFGSPMGIEFDVSQFMPQPRVGNSKRQVWYSKERKIQGKIQFFPPGATNAEEEDAPSDGVCLIDLMDKL